MQKRSWKTSSFVIPFESLKQIKKRLRGHNYVLKALPSRLTKSLDIGINTMFSLKELRKRLYMIKEY